MVYLENYIPVVKYQGLNTAKDVNFSGSFTLSGASTISADMSLGTGVRIIPYAGSDTSTSSAATINEQTGQITTEALTTAAGSTYTMTLTNSLISATSTVLVSVGKGTATTGSPAVTWVTPATGSVVIIIQNIDASAALNGTITINFAVFN